LFYALLERLREIKKKRAYKVAVDAEWSNIQPAISAMSLKLMKELNNDGVFLFNTYQAYLRNAFDTFKNHVEYSKNHGFFLGAKVVRGAYLSYEAGKNPGVTFDNIIDTHYEYDCIIQHVTKCSLAPESVILASHNEESIAKAVYLKEKKSDESIIFAQLHGMRDFIAHYISKQGHAAYKYVPYGTVKEAIPYLARRAEENSGFFKTLEYEKKVISRQLINKLFR
jgi:proline dehydrogenase